MRTRTLLQMRTDARVRSDSVRNRHVTDAQIDVWINQGISCLWDTVVVVDPARYYASTPITTSVGTESYSLPSDFYQEIGVDLVRNGQRTPLAPLNFSERFGPEGDSPDFGVGSPRVRFEIRAQSLYFDPDPGANNYLLHYTRVADTLDSDADTFDGVNGWEDYPVLYAAIAIIDREEGDSGALRADLARIEARIRTMAGLRENGGPTVIANTRRARRSRNHWA